MTTILKVTSCSITDAKDPVIMSAFQSGVRGRSEKHKIHMWAMSPLRGRVGGTSSGKCHYMQTISAYNSLATHFTQEAGKCILLAVQKNAPTVFIEEGDECWADILHHSLFSGLAVKIKFLIKKRLMRFLLCYQMNGLYLWEPLIQFNCLL